MYLSELRLWNFRKYGSEEWDLEKPNLSVPFNEGLNVLIGENDSGKSAIIDAIKLVLKTHAYEWIKVEDEDFFNKTEKLRIELLFKDLKIAEAKNFTEWLGWEGEGEDARPIFRLIYQVGRKNGRILPADIHAGMDEMGYPLSAEAKFYLKSTYLKALRDADCELIAKKNSRLSQILQGHKLFEEKEGQNHQFTQWLIDVNDEIKKWFEKADPNDDGKCNKEQIKGVIDTFLNKFIGEETQSFLELTKPDIKSVLEKMSLGILEKTNLGLGTMNRLYMAVELLHLKKEWDGIKLCLIEELEAHLHPQAQMKVIEAIEKEKDVQFILTTHSPNLASKVNVENLIICNDGNAFPLNKGKTGLEEKNYEYLKRFLDVTKSNLFFAKGVIIVEGWAEEILIPAIANCLGYNLTRHEVSIVNVGSIAYLHFAKIFLRKDGKKMNIPVAIVTDLDVRPSDKGDFDEEQQCKKRIKLEGLLGDLTGTKVIMKLAEEWTLEWCLYKSPTLSELFKQTVSEVHPRTKSFKKNGGNLWDTAKFERALISKLKKGQGDSPIDKVAVAINLANKISKADNLTISDEDQYLKYLVESIKHACRVNNGN